MLPRTRSPKKERLLEKTLWCSCVSLNSLFEPRPKYFADPPPSLQLNKFCVTPRHFLLVTKEFKPQTSPLTPLELIAAYTILKQLGAREKHLAFFNSGELSGASQPHKQ